MKNLSSLFVVLLLTLNAASQVGINTTNPSSTLDVVGQPGATGELDGVIAPRLTGNQLVAKTYTAAQTAAIVYVTSPPTTLAGQVINVDAAGYYYFDGSVWQNIGGGGKDGDAWGVTGEDVTSLIGRQGNVSIGTSSNNGSLQLTQTTDLSPALFISRRNNPNSSIFAVGPQSVANGNAVGGAIQSRNTAMVFSTSSVLFENLDPANDDVQLYIDSKLNGGEVGVGTNAPTKKLDVNGEARIRTLPAGLGTDDVLSTDANGNLRKLTQASLADGDAWGVTGEDVTSLIRRQGNVSIGSASNNGTLQLTPAADLTPALYISRRNDDNIPIFSVGPQSVANGNAVGGVIQSRNTAMVLSTSNEPFASLDPTNNDVQLYIDTKLNGGEVGVGTTSPTKKLDVNGEARIRTLPAGLSTDDVLSTDANGNIRKIAQANLAPDGDAWGVTNEDITSQVVRSGNVHLDDRSNAGGTRGFKVFNDTNAVFEANSETSDAYSSFRSRGGNMFTQYFDLSGPTRWSTGMQFISKDFHIQNTDNLNGANSQFVIQNSTGNVGIGVTNPQSKLQIANNLGTGASFDTFSDYQLLLYEGASPVQSYGLGIESGTFALNAANNYDFKVSGTDKMLLNTNGVAVPDQVRIGAATPNSQYKLRIDNTVTSNETGINPAMLIYQNATTPANIGNGFGTGIWFNTRRGTAQNAAITAQINTFMETGAQGTVDSHSMNFILRSNDTQREVLKLRYDGNVGIGVAAPSQRLEVDGNVRATAFISDTNTYPDYVFEAYEEGTSDLNKDYNFTTLEEAGTFIEKNKHLPGVTSINDLEKTEDGDYVVNVTEVSMQLLEKVEELFLHTLEQQKEIELLRKETKNLQEEIKVLKKQ